MVVGFDLKIKKSVRRIVIPLNLCIFFSLMVFEKWLHTNFFFLVFVFFILLYFFYTMYCMDHSTPFAQWLKRKFSAEKSLLIHRTIFNQLCFFYGSSLVGIATITPNTMFDTNIILVKIIGIVFIAVGILTKALAVHVVGFGPYFYEEIFTHNTKFTFTSRGIYKYIQHPMYTLGYLHGYGSCLLFNSKAAMGIMILSHILVYYFYFKVEKPYIQMVLRQTK